MKFFQFRTPPSSEQATAAYLREHPPQALPFLTDGMFGYSLTRTVHNQDYFYDVFDTCRKFWLQPRRMAHRERGRESLRLLWSTLKYPRWLIRPLFSSKFMSDPRS